MEVASGSPSRVRMAPRWAGSSLRLKIRCSSRRAFRAISGLNCTQIRRNSTTVPITTNST